MTCRNFSGRQRLIQSNPMTSYQMKITLKLMCFDFKQFQKGSTKWHIGYFLICQTQYDFFVLVSHTVYATLAAL